MEPKTLHDGYGVPLVVKVRRLVKGGGEGSRGGRVIGHTKLGHAIYAPADPHQHHLAKEGEHADAASAAWRQGNKRGHRAHLAAVRAHEAARKASGTTDYDAAAVKAEHHSDKAWGHGKSDGSPLRKAGPFIGPRGGKWADAAHTVPWKDPATPDARRREHGGAAQAIVDKIRPAMAKRGISARVEWQSGNDAKITLHKQDGRTERNVGHLIVENGKAKIPRELLDATGHGKERLRSHPEYPKPIQSQFILDLQEALGDHLFQGMKKAATVQPMRLMHKGAIMAADTQCQALGALSLNNTIEDISAGKREGGHVILGSFKIGTFLFSFRRSDRVPGVLTVQGGNLQLPYHMICRTWEQAQAKGPGIVKTFLEGKVPEEGVFRLV